MQDNTYWHRIEADTFGPVEEERIANRRSEACVTKHSLNHATRLDTTRRIPCGRVGQKLVSVEHARRQSEVRVEICDPITRERPHRLIPTEAIPNP